MNNLSQNERVRWLEVLNASATNWIPSWACVRVVSTDYTTGVLTVDQPNADNQAQVLFTGPVAIPPSAYGAATYDFPTWAAYNAGDGDPAVGDQRGAGNGSYVLRSGKTGFWVIGVDSANSRAMVLPVGGGGGGGGNLPRWSYLAGGICRSPPGIGGKLPAGGSGTAGAPIDWTSGLGPFAFQRPNGAYQIKIPDGAGGYYRLEASAFITTTQPGAGYGAYFSVNGQQPVTNAQVGGECNGGSVMVHFEDTLLLNAGDVVDFWLTSSFDTASETVSANSLEIVQRGGPPT